MAQDKKINLYALDCGTVNWRLYRMEYHYDGEKAQHVTSPLSSPLANFSDRKLPAVLTLTPQGTGIEAIGETALSYLEDSEARSRVRDFFKPSIGSHLVKNPSPHQQRYSHFEALLFTRLLLKILINQIREEKYNSEPFDDQIHFSIAYPDNWRTDFACKIFEDFYHVVLECFPPDIVDRVHFVPESEGVILGLRDQSLLERFSSEDINLIIDVGASSTIIYARKYNAETGALVDIDRYEEPFGGGLYDALLAQKLSNQLQIPAKVLTGDPSAFMALRIWGQLIKESLSRKILGGDETVDLLDSRQALTLVMKNGQVFRKNIELSPDDFTELNRPLDKAFQDVLTRGLADMEINEEMIGRVILLGGGVMMPGIQEGIHTRFGKNKVIFPNKPQEIIVRGIGLAFTSSLPEREAEEKKFIPEKKSGWRLVHEKGQIVDVKKEIMIAGRSQESDIHLDSKKCSRTHALIRLEGNALTLIDLRSKNGTFINNVQITPNSPQHLREGDEVRFGDQKFVLK
ncbi:MAG: FHA domain-containing protein [Anaerolineales bacterium]|nr:MAG: FHA domain-containing protein [Anaerolineales bacterium]